MDDFALMNFSLPDINSQMMINFLSKFWLAPFLTLSASILKCVILYLMPFKRHYLGVIFVNLCCIWTFGPMLLLFSIKVAVYVWFMEYCPEITSLYHTYTYEESLILPSLQKKKQTKY